MAANFLGGYQLPNQASAYNFGNMNFGAQDAGTGLSQSGVSQTPFGSLGYNPTQGLNNVNSQFSGLNIGDGGQQQAGVLGANIPTAQLGLSGLSAIGNLWGAFQANKQASNQFDYTKQITDKNLANQTQSYNTALADRAASRGSMEGWSAEQTAAYVDKNKLK